MMQCRGTSHFLLAIFVVLCIGCKPKTLNNQPDGLIVYQEALTGQKLVFEPAQENMWDVCLSSDPNNLKPCDDVIQAMVPCEVPNGRGLCSIQMDSGTKILDYAISESNEIFDNYMKQKIMPRLQNMDGKVCTITRVGHLPDFVFETTYCDDTCVNKIRYLHTQNGVERPRMTYSLISKRGILCK